MIKKGRFDTTETAFPADETTLPQPERDPTDNPHHGHEEQVQTRGIVPPAQQEPGFFSQRNPKVQHPRGKERRINTVERRAEDRRNMK